MREEVVWNSDLSRGKRLCDDGASVDPPSTGRMPQWTSICEDVLVDVSQYEAS